MATVAITMVTMMLITTAGPLLAGATSGECGGLIFAAIDKNGTITSPNHPGPYGNLAHCIWLLEANPDQVVQLSLNGVAAEGTHSDGCIDYLEVRAGSDTEPLMYQGCEISDVVTLTSPSRWLWLRFYSDDATQNTGFSASWEVVENVNTSNQTYPSPACDGTRFTCANRECISWSYVCDGWSDCGCSGPGCDEDQCQGFGLDTAFIIGVGVGVGSLTLILVVLVIVVWNVIQKKRAKRKEAARTRKAAQMTRRRDLTARSGAPSTPSSPRSSPSKPGSALSRYTVDDERGTGVYMTKDGKLTVPPSSKGSSAKSSAQRNRVRHFVR